MEIFVAIHVQIGHKRQHNLAIGGPGKIVGLKAAQIIDGGIDAGFEFGHSGFIVFVDRGLATAQTRRGQFGIVTGRLNLFGQVKLIGSQTRIEEIGRVTFALGGMGLGFVEPSANIEQHFGGVLKKGMVHVGIS